MLGIRSAALLQLALFTCAMLTAWSHRAHERHGYCTEHGALIHVEAEQPSDDLPLRDPVVEQRRHQHGAHNCAMLAFLAGGVAAPGQLDVDAPLGLAAALKPPRTGGSACSIPLLLQAPKASPPLA